MTINYFFPYHLDTGSVVTAKKILAHNDYAYKLNVVEIAKAVDLARTEFLATKPADYKLTYSDWASIKSDIETKIELAIAKVKELTNLPADLHNTTGE